MASQGDGESDGAYDDEDHADGVDVEALGTVDIDPPRQDRTHRHEEDGYPNAHGNLLQVCL